MLINYMGYLNIVRALGSDHSEFGIICTRRRNNNSSQCSIVQLGGGIVLFGGWPRWKWPLSQHHVQLWRGVYIRTLCYCPIHLYICIYIYRTTSYTRHLTVEFLPPATAAPDTQVCAHKDMPKWNNKKAPLLNAHLENSCSSPLSSFALSIAT